MSIFNFPVKDYYIDLGFDFTNEPFESISDEFTGSYEKNCFSCSLHKGAKRALEMIYASGITQSILSAAHQDYLEKCASYYGIQKFFIKLIGLDNTHAAGKLENGKKWVSEIPYKKEEIVLIGDTVHDYEVAKAVGCECILLSLGHHSHDRLESCNVPVAKDIEHVITMLGL
ncbi:MAG: HAD hydrolase-like protein [Clostridia bacterium]|nr:HAD hydrolase-like protein [Clostridia bacterium]